MLKSLSAKIIAAAVLLITVSSAADFIIASNINRTLNTQTDVLMTRVQGAIEEKDTLINELLADNLGAKERTLEAVHTEAAATTLLETEKTRKFLEGTRNGIAVSSLTLIKNAMMMGEAAQAQDMIDTLLENPDIYAINLWRTNGEMSFRDNKTIQEVNALAGTEAFAPRKPSKPILLEGERKATLDTVVQNHQSGLVTLGEAENDDGEMEPVEYAYYLLENTEDCQACHGESTQPRGVLEVGLSRRALMELEQTAQEEMRALDAGQATEKAAVLTENSAKSETVKTRTDTVNADVATGKQHVRDAQDSAFITSLASKTGFFLLTIGVLFWVLSTLLTKPIHAMTDAMSRLAHGDLDADVPAVGRQDEIGQMASAVQVFKENAIEVKRLEADQANAERRAAQERARTMRDLADGFESSVGAVVKIVSTAARGMESSAESLSSAAEQTSSRAETVSSAANQASENVATVASASEELSAAISEISRQVSQSTQISNNAVSEVQNANEKVQGLAAAAQRIGEVVALITDIADQTNLLALNATIEAARAGEAGKGFAVVAGEVKNLATQTARATDDISSQIAGIQGATQEAVDAIRSIGETINRMNEIASTIASAVEEQGAATQEIARNVEHAYNGTSRVSESIHEVSSAAEHTGVAATDIRSSAHDLTEQSGRLAREVEKFLAAIRPKEKDLS